MISVTNFLEPNMHTMFSAPGNENFRGRSRQHLKNESFIAQRKFYKCFGTHLLG